MQYSQWLIAVVVASFLVGCAPGEGASPSAPSNDPVLSRTLVVAHRYEPISLAPKVLGTGGPLSTTRPFNAALAMNDDQGQPIPYLAETLPQLNTQTWRVFPDGRMETTYVLRSGLTWQDGAPITAEDFAFAFEVYRDASFGVFIARPQDVMEAVLAPDPRTVVVQWRAPNPDGGALTFGDLDPLPVHLFKEPFTDYAEGRSSREAFLGNPVWSSDYVGAGPYRLQRWDPGVQIEGAAFDAHVLGRPKIDRFIVRIFIDENTTLAAVLAGNQVDYTCCLTLRFGQLATLKREWESAGKGIAAATTGQVIILNVQQRPEFVGHRGLLDLRVRRALVHTIDRQAINDGVFDGLGAPTETPIPPSVPFHAEAERLITKYPLDPNRAAQLMGEAGFTKDGEGLFVDSQGSRIYVDFAVQSASEIERMQAIQSDTWKRAGFEMRSVAVAPQLFSRLETRHTLPGIGLRHRDRRTDVPLPRSRNGG